MTGGLLVSTRRLDTLTIDPAAGTARIGAGMKWARVIEAAAPYGLAPLTGSSSDAGAVGYTVGGGLGPLGRQQREVVRGDASPGQHAADGNTTSVPSA
jgi:FAD/FMN-containing dehydrogenase